LPPPKQLAKKDDTKSGKKAKADADSTDQAPAPATTDAATTPAADPKPESLPTPIDDPALKVQKPAEDTKNQEVPAVPAPAKPAR
jgi:hypothetical protein